MLAQDTIEFTKEIIFITFFTVTDAPRLHLSLLRTFSDTFDDFYC